MKIHFSCTISYAYPILQNDSFRERTRCSNRAIQYIINNKIANFSGGATSHRPCFRQQEHTNTHTRFTQTASPSDRRTPHIGSHMTRPPIVCACVWVCLCARVCVWRTNRGCASHVSSSASKPLSYLFGPKIVESIQFCGHFDGLPGPIDTYAVWSARQVVSCLDVTTILL